MNPSAQWNALISADWQTVSKENVKSIMVMGHQAKQTFKALHMDKCDFVSPLRLRKPVFLKSIIFQVKFNIETSNSFLFLVLKREN